MRGGVVVLNVFALIWAGVAIVGAGLSLVWLAVPLAITAAVLLWARRPRNAVDPAVERSHIGRLVGIWSAVEGVAIFVVANVLGNLGLMDALVPAIAIIVGLHFLPLARGFPLPLYYATGTALVVIGLAALLLPAGERMVFTGTACAGVLWITSALMIWSSRRPAGRSVVA